MADLIWVGLIEEEEDPRVIISKEEKIFRNEDERIKFFT